MFGWGRSTVELGLKELETGYTCYVEIHERGNKNTEERLPELEQDIKAIVEPHGQVDPKFKTSLLYTRITAKAVRKALMDFKGYTNKELPTERTITNILNRLSYTLKRVLKTKPLLIIKELQLPPESIVQSARTWVSGAQKMAYFRFRSAWIPASQPA